MLCLAKTIVLSIRVIILIIIIIIIISIIIIIIPQFFHQAYSLN